MVINTALRGQIANEEIKVRDDLHPHVVVQISTVHASVKMQGSSSHLNHTKF